ncbi:SseB family protein, partial [Stenotrophomonas rhizophila]
QTPIETLLKTAMDGQLPIGLFMKTFVASEVVLLTGSLVTPDGSGFDPLLFDKQGVLHVSVFTDMSRVGFHSQQAPHTIRMLMLEVLKRVPGGYGVVINPGTSLGFEISPSGVSEILKDFADGPR